MKNNQQQKKTETGWQLVKLGDIGKVSMCKRVLKNQTLPIGDVPFYKIGTFGNTPDAYISKDLYDEYKKKYSYPKKGEILISASGTIGRTVVYDGELAYFQDSNIIWIANDENKVLNKFLNHIYRGVKWKTSSGTIARIYNDSVREIKFKLPSLLEQKRIVYILEIWDNLIEKLTKKIEFKKQIKKGLMQDLLNGKKRLGEFKNEWQNKRIDQIFKINAGGDLLKEGFSKVKIIGYEYPVYSNALTNKGLYGYAKNYRYKGDCVTVTARGEVGDANFRDHDFDAIGRVLILQPKEKINCFFIAEYINNNIIFDIESSGIPQLTAPQISRYKIHLPEFDEQNVIAEILTTADKEITELEKKLSIIKEQKQYLLNNLITGKIRTPENLTIKKQ